jgi:hypothetical protein
MEYWMEKQPYLSGCGFLIGVKTGEGSILGG